MRTVPARISAATYPIAATATAHAYDFAVGEERTKAAAPQASPEPEISGQQRLFSQPVNGPRVVSFDSLRSVKGADSRESARATLPESSRPAPLETGKVELRRPRASGKRAPRDQSTFEFFGPAEIAAPPKPSIICDAAVASPFVRVRAALIDGGLMLGGCAVALALFRACGGRFLFEKQLPFFVAAILTVPLFYKILWTFIGEDTIGMQKAGLRLVDFDGNPPSHGRRYLRLAGSIISLLAAGIGLVWSFVDEDRLTWHDHISGTFPTPAADA